MRNGMQPCVQIAATVTSVGRQMIEHTKSCCEREFRAPNNGICTLFTVMRRVGLHVP